VKTHPELDYAYPDLLDDKSDQRLRSVVADLHAAYATADVPSRLDQSIAQALAHHRREQAAAPRTRLIQFPLPRLLPRGISAVAAALLVALVLAGGAYAITSLIGPVMRLEPGTAYVENAGLGRKLDLRQTINGVTVIVERAYADVNRIVIGYTLEVPPALTGGQSSIGAELILTDSNGKRYYPRHGMGNREPGSSRGSDVMSFDAAGLPADIAEMSFNLTIPEVTTTRSSGPIPTAAPPPETGAAIEVQPAGDSNVTHIAGPWSFDFTIPVLAGQVIEVNQSATAAGISISLERVVVSPTETRAYLRIPETSEFPSQQLQPMAHISMEGWSSRDHQAGPGISGVPVDGLHTFSVLGNLTDKHGEWTLTVDELIGWPADAAIGPDGGLEMTRFAGPWTWTFVVP
jgi:hypothetical protein